MFRVLCVLSSASAIAAALLIVMSNTSLGAGPAPPSNAVFLPMNVQAYKCFNLTTGTVSISVFSFISIIFLLPLYTFVLYLGLKRWRQQSANASTSHIDFLTYNAAVVELLSVLGSTLVSLGFLTGLSELVWPGIALLNMQLFGQMLCHVLTCFEHYLAVVHPIFHRGLKNANCVRIRNIATGCSGLLCFSTLVLNHSENALFTFFILLFSTIISFIAISFCSISILCILIRPGPGKVGGSRQQVDQLRLRAFNTSIKILVVMLLKLICYVISICLYGSNRFEDNIKCNFWLSVLWISMPNGLLLPLLYLKRANFWVGSCVMNNT